MVHADAVGGIIFSTETGGDLLLGLVGVTAKVKGGLSQGIPVGNPFLLYCRSDTFTYTSIRTHTYSGTDIICELVQCRVDYRIIIIVIISTQLTSIYTGKI